MSNIKKEAEHLPKEKEGLPFGKWQPVALTSLNSFALKSKRQPLTICSNSKVYPQMLSSGQNAEECDATKADSSNAAWTIKIFLN
jgi:hypothetical protein